MGSYRDRYIEPEKKISTKFGTATINNDYYVITSGKEGNNGKKIKESRNLLKLIKWFEKEYSDVKLHNEIKEGVF